MTPVPPIVDDIRRLVRLIWRDGDVFELRSLVRVNGQQHTTSGYFDDPEAFVRAAAERSGKDDGVYFTINPTNPALLARAPKNRVRRAGNGDTTSDKDVTRRRVLLVDVDPVRPTGISSTDAEHDTAIQIAYRIRDDLAAAGWPLPIVADSGNGAHLEYAIDLDVDDGGLVHRVLQRLSTQYTTATHKIDEKMFNPARISKIYGTLTRKGENTSDRPHRVARILTAPDQLLEVPRAMLDNFAPAPVAPTRNGNGSHGSRYTVEPMASFDIDTFVANHLTDAQERPWSSGRKWILPVCPFNDSHDRGEAHVEQLTSGAVSAGCLHDSCKWGWRELRTKFEPDAYQPRNRSARGTEPGTTPQRRLTDREPPPEVLYEHESWPEVAAELDTFADRDREPLVPLAGKPLWRRAPALVDEILARANDPWVSLMLGGDVLARVRAGGIVVLIGGSGSGKSSLTACLITEHARDVGPAIVLSIELPADEFGARIVGQRCDASWEDALRGRVARPDMERVLNLPRLYVLDRRKATLANLAKAIDAARAEYPGEPILVAIDYAQLLDSKERESRQRVADVFAQMDDLAREHKVVMLALSQMSRASAQKARRGDAIGAEAADLGAETAAIERFASLTLSIGLAAEREDGSSAVELSVGKARMGKGDVVFPMTHWGRTGLWRVAEDAKSATVVRETRDIDKAARAAASLEHQLVGAATKSKVPLSREQLMEMVAGRKGTKRAAIAQLLASGDLVEVAQHVPRSKKWSIWTPSQAHSVGLKLASEVES